MAVNLSVLDLFSGIGGFSLGLDRAIVPNAPRFKTVAFCEADEYCRRVLGHHWPRVPCYPDVRHLGLADFLRDGVALPDVICFGFPCTDISLAGPGGGLSGARSGLWFEGLRIIEETRPTWVIVENVPALRSRGLDIVLGGLAALRYDAEWNCIPAAALGAPHRRDRIWIVAYPEGVGCRAGRQGRLTDGLAWISDAPRWNPSNTDRQGYPERQGVGGDARQEQSAAERSPCLDVWKSEWPAEPALCGMDDGLSDGVDLGLYALGNSLISGIAEAHGRVILHYEMTKSIR